MLERGKVTHGIKTDKVATKADDSIEVLYQRNPTAALQVVGWWWKYLTSKLGR